MTNTETCDAHPDVTMRWYDMGGPESGPQEPIEMCPACIEEHEHPIITCDVCNTEQRVERYSTAFADFDPTSVAHLACGHTVI